MQQQGEKIVEEDLTGLIYFTQNNISVQKPSSGNLVHDVGVGDNCW
jgi:hypothetical protein